MTDSIPTAGGGDPEKIRLAAQSKKLAEANAKYKNLLKLAKERIQQQEEEIQQIRNEKIELEQKASEDRRREDSVSAVRDIAIESEGERASDEVSHNILRVCQLVKQEDYNGGPAELWALLDVEAVLVHDADVSPTKRFKEWKRFGTESELQDFIRRDTGEPLRLPPLSLSPDQSTRIQKDCSSQVSKITEEFRRFRVKAEVNRKQAEAQIRDLQSTNFQTAALRIEGQDRSHLETEQVKSLRSQLERAKEDFSVQDAQWREAYDILVAENNALKSSGSEALLASQWRQRYESCLLEKKDLEDRLRSLGSRAGVNGSDSFEVKYRDLKESFRMYRKKAKEIFEAQERGAVPPLTEMDTLNIADTSSAEAKLSYLKNLMVNYLSADQTVRDHMESAIGTVLQFTPHEMERINARKKAESDSWF